MSSLATKRTTAKTVDQKSQIAYNTCIETKKEHSMKLMITTQIQENYGAHDWDGTGECPQYWKFKGGNDYSYSLGSYLRNPEALAELVEVFRGQIEEDNEGFREYIIAWSVEADDYLTDFEKSQLEYDGRIAYPTKELKLLEAA
jgi:hypothetical protein